MEKEYSSALTASSAAFTPSEATSYYVALYAVVSFILVALLVLLLYVACAKRYKLNWFEKNLLESEDEHKLACSHEALMCAISSGSGEQDSNLGSNRTLCATPVSDDKFWVPHNLQRQPSASQLFSEPTPLSEDEKSMNENPHIISGAIGNYNPAGMSFEEGCYTPPLPGYSNANVPIARNDHHVVLTAAPTAPMRPRVSSMQSKLDHTKIDTTLYQKQEQPDTEVEDVRGKLHITLTYDPVAEILTVKLIEAHDLQARDFSGTADPYAKIRLLPDKSNFWQTRIHKRTLNPVFDEDFVFEVRPATIGRRTLEILLYDFDAYSRHHSIGGIKLPLTNIDLTERVTLWRPLYQCSEQDTKAELGDLMVSLSYLPSAERLTVVIIKARNLRVVDDTRISSDPYVKVSLVNNTKRLKKRKTGIHRNTINPVFNEALTFDISKDNLRSCFIEFCVLHDSLLGASELLGRCLVGRGPECAQEQRDFFNEMFHSKSATAQWLPLSDPRSH